MKQSGLNWSGVSSNFIKFKIEKGSANKSKTNYGEEEFLKWY